MKYSDLPSKDFSKPYCSSCGTTTGRLMRASRRFIGSKEKVYYKCCDCNTERMKRYRYTEEGKLAMKKAMDNYESRNPDRRKAWTKARELPNKPCVICGKQPSHKHHPDTKKPLFVIYLCPYHHKQAHKQAV